MRHQRLSVLVVSLLIISGFVVVATRHSKGERTFAAEGKQIKVLRRKGHLGLGLTTTEIASFKKNIQEEERELEVQVPKHLPIRIKIKAEKERKFKDLKNENWARDFELEVTNTGNKPIYFLYILLITDVKAAAGYRIVFPLYFGRTELGEVGAKARPDDVSIKPGENYGFKIHAGQMEAWELKNRKENRPHPKKILAKFQKLFFGDGTGYGPGGVPLPSAWKDRGSVSQCVVPQNGGGPSEGVGLVGLADNWPSKRWTESLPASFPPVNFLSPNSSSSLSFLVNTQPQSCCPGNGCTSLISHTVKACVNCPDQERPSITYCGDPAGGCWSADYSGSLECFLGNGQEYVCQVIDMTPCGAPPTPTPSSTPTPSPSPTPETCDPATRPNPTNCTCEQLPGIGFLWQCGCGQVEPADYVRYPQSSGCDPGKQANNGNNCCVCIAQNVPCEPGYSRNSYSCECVQNPLQTPTPTPPNEGGGGGEQQNAPCTTYYWVLYDCQPVGESGWSCTQVAMWEAGCF